MKLIEQYTNFKSKDLSRVSGIYSISAKDGRIYIGESKNISLRFSCHIETLLKNIHGNEYLQNYVNKYGMDSIVFDVIELCPIEELKIREHHWVHTLGTLYRERGFNIRETSPDGKYIPSAETRIKIGLAKKGRKLSPEQIEKTRKGNTGKKRSEESKQRYRESRLGEKNPMFGKKLSAEACRIISERNKALPKTEKQLEALNKFRYDPSRKIIIDGIIYNSAVEASNKLDLTLAMIRYRLKVKKENYHYYDEYLSLIK